MPKNYQDIRKNFCKECKFNDSSDAARQMCYNCIFHPTYKQPSCFKDYREVEIKPNKTWQVEAQREEFCDKCSDNDVSPHAFPCSRCFVIEEGKASHFTPLHDVPPEENEIEIPQSFFKPYLEVTMPPREGEPLPAPTYTYENGLTFRKDKNGVTVSGLHFDNVVNDFWEDVDELRTKFKDEKGKMNVKKLNEYFTAEEIADLKENPLLVDKILDQITNPLYERRRAEVKEVEKQQIVKAAEKYPEPLNPHSWTGVQLVNHGLQEVHDLTNYLTALLIKFEALEHQFKYVCDENTNFKKIKEKIITEARYWKKCYKSEVKLLEEYEAANLSLAEERLELTEALDKAGDELAKQALTIENLRKGKTPNLLEKGAVNANFQLQAEIKLLREKNANLHEELGIMAARNKQLQERNDNQAESIEQLMQEKEKVEKDFITLEGSYDDLYDEHEAFKKKNLGLENEIHMLRGEIQIKSEKLISYENKIDDLSKRLANATVKISENNSDDLDTQFNMRIKQRTIDEQRLEIKKITRWHDEAIAANKGLGKRIDELEIKLAAANRTNHFKSEKLIDMQLRIAKLMSENKALRNEHICEKNQRIYYDWIRTGKFFGGEVKKVPVAVKCDICDATLWSKDNA